MPAATQQTFTINNLKEIADIDNHIDFLNRLLKKHDWNNTIKQNVIKDLSFIEKKKKDKNLNLSVIGEFSSGKSTFINALLRDNLLEADIIQGTTVASTVIRYAPKHAIIINYKNGKQSRFVPEDTSNFSMRQMREYVKELTTNEKNAKSIKEVIIEHPSVALKEGITIIDTPGTNSTERWHEDVTRTAIRDVSDVSIILTSAVQPLPDSLNDFVQQNLGDVLSRCVFVVTKMDLLRQKERDRQIEYVKQKITNTFGITSPQVFPYTPLFVLGEIDQTVKNSYHYGKDDYGDLIQQSYQTETKIYEELMEQRVIIQVQKLLSVMNNIFTYLSEDMIKTTADYQKSHEILSKATKRDLKEFTEDNKAKHSNGFFTNARNTKQAIMNQIYFAINVKKEVINRSFDGCDTKVKLQAFIDTTLPQLLKKSAEELFALGRDRYSDFDKDLDKELQIFLKDFQLMYNQLQELNMQALQSNFNQTIESGINMNHYQDSLKSLVAQDTAKEDKAITGVGIGGAVIGQILIPIPIVGAIIGGFVGGIIGAMFSPPFSELKSQCRSQVATSMNEYFNRMVTVIEQDVDQYMDRVNGHLTSQIGLYFDSYGKLVKEMIVQDEKKKYKLQLDIASLKSDVGEIENRKYKISTMKDKVNKL